VKLRRIVAISLSLGTVTTLSLPRPAFAEPASPPVRTILLVSTEDDDATVTRVAAELRSLGFDVVASTERGVSVDLLRSTGAIAAVAIGPRGGEIRVFTNETPVPRATIENSGDPVSFPASAPTPLRIVPPRSEDRPHAPERTGTSRIGASIAAAVAGSPGSATATWQGLATAHWLFAARWGIEATGVLPLSSAHWTGDEGSAQLAFGLVAAGLRAELFSAPRYVADVGIGCGAAFVHLHGSPNPGFTGGTSNETVATPYARLGFAVAVAPWLRARADITAFVAVPRLAVTFAGRDVGTWGQPLAIASIGVEVVTRLDGSHVASAQ
jgi:hypothetical protein